MERCEWGLVSLVLISIYVIQLKFYCALREKDGDFQLFLLVIYHNKDIFFTLSLPFVCNIEPFAYLLTYNIDTRSCWWVVYENFPFSSHFG